MQCAAMKPFAPVTRTLAGAVMEGILKKGNRRRELARVLTKERNCWM